MSLSVIERQTATTWYELWGKLEARELFPKLLPNSESVKDAAEEDEIIRTESEKSEGRYDGCSGNEDDMENEIAAFTESAIKEFHDEAVSAAKTALIALKKDEILCRRDYEGVEQTILEEAAQALGVAVPWDPAEAAQIAAERAAQEARLQREREERELRARQISEVLEKATGLFKSGSSHAAVRTLFPGFVNEIAQLVGKLRAQGVQIAK